MGSRWAILIGVNGYHESLGALNFCTSDARLMHETLASECCAFPTDNMVLLTDDQPKDRQPTFGNIHSWLGTWLARPASDDLVLVFFAGHGREANGQALLAPLDATLDSLPVTGIPIQYVRDMLDRCRAAQKVLILDACHSGAGRDVATMTTSFRETLDAGKGLYTIASCDADQISYEWPEHKHGVFTHYLAEAIHHSATANHDGRVTLDRVYDSIRDGVSTWTATRRLKQEPVRICRTKGDIHIALRPLSPEKQLELAKTQIRVLEETIGRQQDEIQKLLDENVRLIEKNQADAKVVKRQGAKAPRVTVKQWEQWVGNKGPYGEFTLWSTIIAAPALVGGLIVGVPLVGDGYAYFIGCTEGALVGLLLGFGIAATIWLPWRLTWLNRYRLYCLQECVKGGDVVGASAYADSMGRFGIDLGTGAAAICSVADLAVGNDDMVHATTLYQLAREKWKSSQAVCALQELRLRED